MVKVFFADGGTLEQLRATLEEVERTATERIGELRSMIDGSMRGPYEFESRLPVNALALRFQLDHEANVARWAAWAREQTRTWRSPTDPAGWDWAAALAP